MTTPRLGDEGKLGGLIHEIRKVAESYELTVSIDNAIGELKDTIVGEVQRILFEIADRHEKAAKRAADSPQRAYTDPGSGGSTESFDWKIRVIGRHHYGFRGPDDQMFTPPCLSPRSLEEWVEDRYPNAEQLTRWAPLTRPKDGPE